NDESRERLSQRISRGGRRATIPGGGEEGEPASARSLWRLAAGGGAASARVIKAPDWEFRLRANLRWSNNRDGRARRDRSGIRCPHWPPAQTATAYRTSRCGPDGAVEGATIG